MSTKLYFFALFLFLSFQLAAQDCSSLQFTCSTTESRCMATGSITINAAGGSGNYNYKVTGPVSPPYTNSSVITGLSAGYYTVAVKDVTNGCIKELDSIYVPGSYRDPRFQLTKTDATCAGNDGTISAANLTAGRSPFTYTIISPSPSSVGATSSDGSFTGLTAGEYYVRLTDSCGGIQVRRVTIQSYDWYFNSVSVSKVGCDSASAVIQLKDNRGNTGTGFDGYMYGVVENTGDTAWYSSSTFTFYLGKKEA